MHKMKNRLEQFEENPTYQAELTQKVNLTNTKIDQLRIANRELEVRQNIDSLSIVKQTRQDEDQTADHVKKLKGRHDEYQVVIYNLTNAENADQKTQLQKDTLEAKIDSLKSEFTKLKILNPGINIVEHMQAQNNLAKARKQRGSSVNCLPQVKSAGGAVDSR